MSILYMILSYFMTDMDVHYGLGLDFLNVLGSLTVVGDLSKAEWQQRFSFLQNTPLHYYIIVIEDIRNNKGADPHHGSIAAAGTLFTEHKFIHKAGLVGHIEDIVVHEQYRGNNFGKWYSSHICNCQHFHCVTLSRLLGSLTS
jgi:ribosomal protein S18 acetylase RimI-like enzyme